MGHRLRLGVGSGRPACEQGRVASFPLPSSGTWSLRAAHPACSRSACTLCSLSLPPAAHPLRAAPLDSARPGTGNGSWGAYLRGPRAVRRALGRRRATGGRGPRAAPSRRAVSGARAELYLRSPAPACAPPSLVRGGTRRGPTGRGTSATCSCCAGSEEARLGAPRPCRRQTGPGRRSPHPLLADLELCVPE